MLIYTFIAIIVQLLWLLFNLYNFIIIQTLLNLVFALHYIYQMLALSHTNKFPDFLLFLIWIVVHFAVGDIKTISLEIEYSWKGNKIVITV